MSSMVFRELNCTKTSYKSMSCTFTDIFQRFVGYSKQHIKGVVSAKYLLGIFLISHWLWSPPTSWTTWKPLQANMLNHVLDYLLERGIMIWCVPVKLIVLFLLHFIEITDITRARGTIIRIQLLSQPLILGRSKMHTVTDEASHGN